MASIARSPAMSDDLRAIAAAVDRGDATKEQMATLRCALAEMPEVSRQLGDVMHLAATHIIDTMQMQSVVKMAVKEQYGQLVQSLLGDQATPLERLLAEQVALTWLRLGYVEMHYADVTNGGSTIAQADFWERRLNAAQRRFLRAVETLARVRKLELPAIGQLNIGQNQINQAIQ